MSTKQKVVDRLLGIPPCNRCESRRVILTFNIDRDHIEIQRCDNCKVFESDIGAWEYVKPSRRKIKIQAETKEAWYRKQIEGLYLIMDDADKKDFMISREYVKEKLRMILNGGINFHPSIKESVGLR